MKKTLFTILISFILIVRTGSASKAGIIHPDLEMLLQTLTPDKEVHVIVTLSDQVDLKKIKNKYKDDKGKLGTAIIFELKDKADKTQKLLKNFLKLKKAKKVVSYWIFNGLAVTAGASVIEELAGQPGVESIRLDDTLSKPEPAPAAEAPPEWNLITIGAPALWDMGYTGSGIVVAGVDTGVDANHSDLVSRWRGGSNSWFDPNGEHATPYDADGHGTQTMGIIVGGDATGTAIGVAPGAQWIAVKIFNDGGTALYSNIHLAYQWLLDPDGNPSTNDFPDVVNNSWGFRNNVNECIPEFQPDIQALKTAEIAVVFSAGNEGPSPATSISPANYAESFAVGSVDQDFILASSSSRGPSACDGSIYPEMVAPGVNIKTADLTYGGIFPDAYTSVYGTSFSAPHVAGAMALLLNAYPQTTVSELETSLIDSALDLGPNGPDNDYGNGLIDVMEAYLLLGQAQSPTCTDADGDGFYSTVECSVPVDCDDTDPNVYPGAPEVKSDGIDQDCNGYDLTINIIKAEYRTKRDTLSVKATSALGKNAALELLGYGPMNWNKKASAWTISVRKAGGNPGMVTVSGIEGSDSAQTISK